MRLPMSWTRLVASAAPLSRTRTARRAMSTRTPHSPSSIASALGEKLAAPHVLEHLQRFGFCIIDRALSGVDGPAAAASTPAAPAPAPGSASSSSPVGLSARSAPCASELSARLRSEILQLRSRGLMRPNHTHLVQGASRSFVPKQAILEADFAARPELLTNESGDDALAVESRRFWRDLCHSPLAIDALNSQLGARCTIASQTVKAQVNEGDSGCFPCQSHDQRATCTLEGRCTRCLLRVHFDTDPRVDSRKVTGVLYLNPSWSGASDGGSLRLYPFPHAPIDISPIDERLVLFDSSRMLHRVLPAARQRVCVSVWWWQQEQQWRSQMEQRRTSDAFSAPFAVQQTAALRHLLPSASSSQLQCLSHLLSPSYYPHFAKLSMQHEWFESVEQSHPDSHERQIMLVNHLDECDMIERALAPLLKQLHQHGDNHDADDAAQAWRAHLPLPWPEPPTLPPHCQLVQSSSASAPVPSTPAAAGVDTANMRLVEWLA